ncbi:Putative esterase [Robiginitalea myxolifaciens]|uniref:Putative esterase n=1 Tax=Robiginitalea myxolifaciens TaxID=400055 RepID=A0A1I6HGN2_9FLAO|nr:alpha/beta hydrolase-fold protein [Robiginitalea myxolifaciens]SFR53528.1 Putative esterase [Robiginitalea myxolifaciens]
MLQALPGFSSRLRSLNLLSCAVMILILLSWGCSPESSSTDDFQVNIRLSDSLSSSDFDGRLLLMLSDDPGNEPRFQINAGLNTQMIFGMNVADMAGSTPMTFSAEQPGFPYNDLSEVPPGKYQAQALLHVYETFELSTGHTVKLPMDNGEGQQWNRSPGNLYSTPMEIEVTESGIKAPELILDQVIPPIPEPEDTPWIKHIKIRSERLSEFWGRDMYLGAHVLLPKGFEEHPEARYPLMIFHGHFPSDFGGFRTTPPDEDMEPVYSERFGVEGYNIIQQQEAYDFYQRWNEPDFPRFLIVEIQHPTPYYDDSYAVNSASQGPYGDAITYELIPYIEEQFRGQGEGWSRFLYGGSTGGWEALAVQVKYPEEYNGCFAACPDPIDFRAYCLTNIYEDENAYYYASKHKPLEVPAHRDYLGQVHTTVKEYNQLEWVLGDKSRSGQQWDIWEATYSPQGADGYPQRIWDKQTGVIDKQVAEYWKENYDLRHILERDWDKLGPKLRGKIHIYCGDMDNYYLNNAVYLMEDFLEQTTDPYYDGEVLYGDRAEHCWNGDPELPNHLSRLRYNSMYVPKIMQRIAASAPAGADLTSWRYK